MRVGYKIGVTSGVFRTRIVDVLNVGRDWRV